MCLQVLFFAPKNLLSPQQSFGRFAGRLIVSPVVRVLVFSKVGSTCFSPFVPSVHHAIVCRHGLSSQFPAFVGAASVAAAGAAAVPMSDYISHWGSHPQNYVEHKEFCLFVISLLLASTQTAIGRFAC